MIDLAVREADRTAVDSLFPLFERFLGGPPPLYWWAVYARVRGDSTMMATVLADAERATNGLPAVAGLHLARYFDDYELGRRFAGYAARPGRAPAVSAAGHLALAELDLAQGRWVRAFSAFNAASSFDPAAGRELLAACATLPFLVVDDADLSQLRARLETWTPAAADAGAPLVRALEPFGRHYVLGLVHARLGREIEAMRHADELDRLTPPPAAGAVVRGLALTIRADVALRRGRTGDALRLLQGVRGEIPSDLLNHPLYSEEHARWLRAEALFQMDRLEDAIRWYTHGFNGTPHELAYRAPAELRLAQIHESLNRPDRARLHYARFVELWDDADDQLQPRLEEARRALERLSPPA